MLKAPVPPSVLWQYFVDPEKRLRWETNNKAIESEPNSRGRLGPGAYTHCSLEGCEHRYIDWRPFNYFTEEVTKLSLRFLDAGELVELDSGTHWVGQEQPQRIGGILADFFGRAR